MSSSGALNTGATKGLPETRGRILDAARAMFEEFGYHGASLAEIAKRAGVSRQAIYLHFPSKVELLTALHQYIRETEVVPALDRHPIAGTTVASDALDARIAAFVEIAGQVWRIHDTLTAARRHHPEVDETLRPGEMHRYEVLIELGEHLAMLQALPPEITVETFADDLWGMTGTPMYQSMVVERGWSPDRFEQWLGATIRRHIGVA